MAYDDAIAPAWRKWERILTRQVLRQVDEDPTHFIRFDPSNIAALQRDQLVQAQVASLMGNDASLNERRAVIGLEPSKDPKADEIPALTQPSFADLLAASKTPPNDPTDPKDAKDAEQQKALRARLERKFAAAALVSAFRVEAVPVYVVHAHKQLQHDADRIAEIVTHTLLEVGVTKGLEAKSRGKARVMSGVNDYLNGDGKKAWTGAMQPLNTRSAERSGAAIAAEMNINFALLRTNLVTYARKQTATQVTNVNETTRSLISDIIQGGLDASASTKEIAGLIRDATAFDLSRAKLIAQTETTKAFSGAPTESLSALGRGTGRKFTKTWSGTLDDKERDEHLELEGETVGIDEEFSNGLQYPSEPNCRCTVLFDETTEE